MEPFDDSGGDFDGALADLDKAGQESAPMTEEEAPLEGLFQAGLLTLLTLCPTVPLLNSSTGAEFTAEESATDAGGGGEEGGAAAVTIWLHGEETPGLGE